MLPTVLFLALDEWVYNALVFVASSYGVDDEAKTTNTDVLVICFQYWTTVWSLFWGIGLATQVRVGRYLGANEPQLAKRAAGIGAVSAISISAVLTIALYFTRRILPTIFSTSERVIEAAADATWLFCFSQSLGTLSLLGCAVLEGLSLQTILSFISFVASWVIVLPTSCVLVFYTYLGARGIWVGSACGETMRLLLATSICICVDWRRIATKAQKVQEVLDVENGSSDYTGSLNSSGDGSSEPNAKNVEAGRILSNRVGSLTSLGTNTRNKDGATII